MRIFAVLRRRHLATLWAGQVLSALGDTLYSIAVVWIAVEAVGSSAGIVAASQATATLVGAPVGGVLADRWDRRRTMIAVDVVRALAVATLPVAGAFANVTLPHLIAVAIVLGALNALFTPALQASLPALSRDPAELHATNSLMDATFRLARAVGPSMAGALAARISITHFFTIDAISFVVSAFAISLLARSEWKVEEPPPRASGFIREIGTAVGLVRAHRPLAHALIGSFVSNAAWASAFTVGAALFASRELDGDIGAYGSIVGAYGVGNIVSNLVMGNYVSRRTVHLFLGQVILGAGFVLFSFAPTLHTAMLVVALAAIGGPIGSLTMIGVIQNEIPRAQIGKVFSLRMCLEYAGITFGLLIAAPLFALLPVRLGIALCALAMLAYGTAGILRFRASDRR